MIWSDEKDIIMMKEVSAFGVFSHKSGSRERGAAWRDVGMKLNQYDSTAFFADDMQRAVRERFAVIMRKYKQKNNAEFKATGLGGDEMTEYDLLLEDLIEQSNDADLRQETESAGKKAANERELAKAKDIRETAMERLSETRKRKKDLEEDDTECGSSSKKSRRSSSDTLLFLKEKLEADKAYKSQDIEEKRNERFEFQQLIALQEQQSADNLALFQQQMQQQAQQQQMMQQQMIGMMSLLQQQMQKKD